VIERLSESYSRFGLGRPTGIGLVEAKGRLPRSFPMSMRSLRRSVGFFAGIGQGWVAATPIQMANGVAMIARGGVWMRPQLLLPERDGTLPPVKEGAWRGTPERVDLHLPPEALAAAKDGMWHVVNGESGTGKAVAAGDKMLLSAMICGKTGTAQASKFTIPKLDASGKVVHDEQGRVVRVPVPPSQPGAPNPDAPWYRMDKEGKIDHAWYEGFAPRDNPQIAFAVMVEYGGSGGVAAASVAREALEACIARGYLKLPSKTPSTRPTALQAAGEEELPALSAVEPRTQGIANPVR
jgi:penicillin-binding protein 2